MQWDWLIPLMGEGEDGKHTGSPGSLSQLVVQCDAKENGRVWV